MRYHTAVIISLFTALGSLAASSRKLMKLGANADRIVQLEDIAAEISAGAVPGAWRVLPRSAACACAGAGDQAHGMGCVDLQATVLSDSPLRRMLPPPSQTCVSPAPACHVISSTNVRF